MRERGRVREALSFSLSKTRGEMLTIITLLLSLPLLCLSHSIVDYGAIPSSLSDEACWANSKAITKTIMVCYSLLPPPLSFPIPSSTSSSTSPSLSSLCFHGVCPAYAACAACVLRGCWCLCGMLLFFPSILIILNIII